MPTAAVTANFRLVARRLLGETGRVEEIPLPGGALANAVRVGDTVRRRPGQRAEFVHRLLRHFEHHGWPGAPRFLGYDDHGREILSYLDGHIGPEPTANLADIARLIRECHDLTAGTALAGDHEVVCHNDLAPKNTVYRHVGGLVRPVAFLDWDLAAPGRRIHDVAHACWQYLAVGPTITDIAATARQIRTLCDAYGPLDQARLVDTIVWWQERCWRGIDTAAASRDPVMAGLRDRGAVAEVRAAHAWTVWHRDELTTALLDEQ